MTSRGRLKAAVYVQSPSAREELILLPGDYPAREVAVLVTNPEAWEEPPDGSNQSYGPILGEKGGAVRE
ncbi:hypothetical protein [Streptomyces eurythermus]|uniref:hypothetical protein n=1 Tax=Streptomyces eurythermus TaxID=42237 RepID=UPI0033CFDF1A